MRRHAFSPLTQKQSVANFASLELKFISALLWAWSKRKGHKQVYIFNKKWELTLDNFQGGLENLVDDDTHWQSSVQALCSLFDEVYFSEAYETKNTEFEMPSTTFLATQSLSFLMSWTMMGLTMTTVRIT